MEQIRAEPSHLARAAFAPWSLAPPGEPHSRTKRSPVHHADVGLLRDFYRGHIARFGLAICLIVLAYGGGAIMFWFHSIYLNEGGPAISPWVHWLIDSTAGLVGLSPAIAVIVPLAAWASDRSSGELSSAATHPARFAAVGGTVLALVTAPAPLLHDALIGRGTWLAAEATRLFGNGHHPTGQPQDAGVVVTMAQQLAVGVPTYVVLMGLALLLARGLVRLTHRVRPVLDS